MANNNQAVQDTVETSTVSADPPEWLQPELANDSLTPEGTADWPVIEMRLPILGGRNEKRRYPPPGGRIKVDPLTAKGLIADNIATLSNE